MSLNKQYAIETPSVTVMLGGATFTLKHHDAAGIPYTKLMRELLKPYKRQLAAGGSLPVEVEREISIRAFVRCTMIGWQDLKIDDADADYVPYSEDKACEIFALYPRLYADLVAEATDIEQFRKSDLAETIKN